MSDLLGTLRWGAAGWGDELAAGLAVTLRLSLISLPCGLLLGLLLAMAQRARLAVTREASSLLTALVRGVPELLTLLLVYFGGQILLNKAASLLGHGPVAFDAFIAGVITLSFLFASYSSEVFVGVLRVLSRSSLEAAKSLGLGRVPTLIYVVLPELFRLSLPGLSNLWFAMVKQTALISVIGYGDLLRAAYVAASSTGDKVFFYVIACLLYLVVTQGSGIAIRRLSARLGRGLS